MKVIGINGSSRKDGNTAILIKKVFSELEKEGIETELIQLSGQNLKGCTACGLCSINKDGKCVIDDDMVNDVFKKMCDADGIILGSPVYFSNITPEIKAMIDRTGRIAKANDYLLRRKVGASVVAVRRAGALPTFNAMNIFFFVEQMIVPGSTYWNLGIGMDKGDVEKDTEGMRNMVNLGQNMAWLIKKLRS